MALEEIADGWQRAVGEAVGGVIVAALLSVMAAMPMFQESFGWFFALIAVVPLAGLLLEMRLWSIFYTAGWIIGVVYLSYNVAIIPPYEAALFIGTPASIWGLRIYVWIRDR